MLVLSPSTRFSVSIIASTLPSDKKNLRPRKIRRLHHSSPESEEGSPPSPFRLFSPLPLPSLAEINRKYRAFFYPIDKLPSVLTSLFPFPEKPVNLIVEYAKSPFHPYVIAPELVDPRVPLEESLEHEPIENEPSQTQVRQKKRHLSGSNGTVGFTRFKNDPKAHRWFAIKQEVKPEDRADFLTQSNPPSPRSCFDAYETNYRIFSKIAGHPSFMKIFGLVMKEKKVKDEEENRNPYEMRDDGRAKALPPFSPYLILENIEGDNLHDLLAKKALSLTDQYQILEQFNKGMFFLFEKRIIPHDALSYNLILTEDKQLKFIDYDMWRVSFADLDSVAGDVYEMAVELFNDFAIETTSKLDISIISPPPAFSCHQEDVGGSLTSSLEKLLEWYKEIT